ncbi:uncharacterized protein EAF01_001492 [Botrytis porri]|uniref:Uncharacterized protein n=1 Tax=Botrytis porri TaxID=87229 RepID=A0A4Z1KJL5_9HELO|nr:uncharacterized protein EAF01_001492 [Botrytis porri]KAF7912471.1 hypothetical protein EAF01_001492 [Botrytis porri]TGO85690.1 hypothetical protein BPOR_0373g00090 [Botrytis porri]
MSTSLQTSISDLTGITVPSNNSCEWIFHGDTISMNQYSGDIDEDLASDLVDGSTSCNFATAKSDRHSKFVNASARPSSFDYRLPDSICVASSHAHTEVFMRPHYTVPSSESTSQYSIFIPTPTTSVDYSRDNNIPTSQNDSVGLQDQSAYSVFPTYTSDSTPLDNWLETPERHEQIAFNILNSTTHPATQNKGKKLAGKCVQKFE